MDLNRRKKKKEEGGGKKNGTFFNNHKHIINIYIYDRNTIRLNINLLKNLDVIIVRKLLYYTIFRSKFRSVGISTSGQTGQRLVEHVEQKNFFEN